MVWAVVLVALEALAVVIATGWLAFELLTVVPEYLGTAVSLTLIVAIAAVWLVVLTVQLWQRRPWTRSGAITWQVLQIAVAVGAFQGSFAQPVYGWVLLVPAVAVLVLMLTPAATAALARHPDGGNQPASE